MIKKIAIGIVAALAACDAEGLSDKGITPTESTVISTRCNGYTERRIISEPDGSIDIEVLERSAACGWDPEPRGELYEEACEAPYTLVSTYHDGEYGFYEERSPDSEQCGYVPVVFNVALDDTFGDRFKPAVFSVEYEVRGEPAEWEYDAGDLRAERVGSELHVYGNGQEFQQEVLINDEPFMVQFSPEPRCPKVEPTTDCLGYSFLGDDEGLIYYGEEDDQIVTLDLVFLQVIGECTEYGAYTFLCEDELDRSFYEERVDRYNSVMERSGVFVRFNLKELKAITTTGLNAGLSIVRMLDADIGLGRGTSCPDSCGCALVNTSFRRAGYGVSRCGWGTDLHELGHIVGLAHGPENRAYAANGYVFPRFGHGWNNNRCNMQGDLMSYNYSSYVFLNSRQTCAEVWEEDDDVETRVTDWSYADSAYHWNRVRYDLSLIFDEHTAGTVLQLREIDLDEEEILVVD